MPEATEYVTVPVPVRHVTAVYDLIARLERGDDETTDTDTPEPHSGLTPTDSELTRDLVERMWRESDTEHRRFIKLLADNAGTWFYTGEAAEALGLPHGRRSLAGSIGAFHRRSKHRYHGRLPWDDEWDYAKGEAKYRVNPKVAAWIDESAS